MACTIYILAPILEYLDCNYSVKVTGYTRRSHDAQEYIHTFTNEYEKLGCEVNANAFVLEYKNQMLKKTKVEFSVL